MRTSEALRRQGSAQHREQDQFTHGRLTWVSTGQVVVDAKKKEWSGAVAHTNNTGELTAMQRALLRASTRPAGGGKEMIWSDSLYTINMTTGRWLPKRTRNNEIIARLRCAWRWIQRARPGEVRIRHVRSHTKNSGNEIADWLADEGRMGGTPTLDEADRWLKRWRARQRGDG